MNDDGITHHLLSSKLRTTSDFFVHLRGPEADIDSRYGVVKGVGQGSGGSGVGSAAEGTDSRASGEEASAERNESARRASRAAEREAAKRGERREQTESSCNLLATELVA